MGTSRKNRRKLVNHGRNYFWYVSEDIDSFPQDVMPNLYALNMISEDKRFIVRYHLGQKNEKLRHIIIIGNEFVGADCTGPWRRFRCPKWGKEDKITPGDVKEVIDWCL